MADIRLQDNPQLRSAILASEVSDRPAYLDVSVNLISKTSESPFEVTSQISNDDTILAN
ncbi:MAG: hypothetical protein ACJAVK_001028 [Akkermansiaceae bacterium]|jgi:hypothetical protein